MRFAAQDSALFGSSLVSKDKLTTPDLKLTLIVSLFILASSRRSKIFFRTICSSYCISQVTLTLPSEGSKFHSSIFVDLLASFSFRNAEDTAAQNSPGQVPLKLPSFAGSHSPDQAFSPFVTIILEGARYSSLPSAFTRFRWTYTK